MVVLVAAGSMNNLVNGYCKANKLRLVKFIGRLPIDQKMKETYDFAIKAVVEDLLNKKEECYIFCGKKAKFGGFYLLNLIKIS